jgi:hypothetical protein
MFLMSEQRESEVERYLALMNGKYYLLTVGAEKR